MQELRLEKPGRKPLPSSRPPQHPHWASSCDVISPASRRRDFLARSSRFRTRRKSLLRDVRVSPSEAVRGQVFPGSGGGLVFQRAPGRSGCCGAGAGAWTAACRRSGSGRSYGGSSSLSRCAPGWEGGSVRGRLSFPPAPSVHRLLPGSRSFVPRL